MIRSTFLSFSFLILYFHGSSVLASANTSNWMIGLGSSYAEYSLKKSPLGKDLKGVSHSLYLGKSWQQSRYDLSLLFAYSICPCGKDYVQKLDMDFSGYALELLFKFNLNKTLRVLSSGKRYLFQVPLSLRYETTNGESSGLSSSFTTGDPSALESIKFDSQKMLLSTGLAYTLIFKEPDYNAQAEAAPTYIKKIYLAAMVSKSLWTSENLELNYHQSSLNSKHEEDYHKMSFRLVFGAVVAL